MRKSATTVPTPALKPTPARRMRDAAATSDVDDDGLPFMPALSSLKSNDKKEEAET